MTGDSSKDNNARGTGRQIKQLTGNGEMGAASFKELGHQMKSLESMFYDAITL